MIQSDKLYDADLDHVDSGRNQKAKDALKWISTYSHNVNNKIQEKKRSSLKQFDSQSSSVSPNRKRGSKFGKSLVSENIFRHDSATLPIDQLLKLNEGAKDELKQIEEFNFNIFTLRSATNENELLVGTTYLLHKNDLFSASKI